MPKYTTGDVGVWSWLNVEGFNEFPIRAKSNNMARLLNFHDKGLFHIILRCIYSPFLAEFHERFTFGTAKEPSSLS